GAGAGVGGSLGRFERGFDHLVGDGEAAGGAGGGGGENGAQDAAAVVDEGAAGVAAAHGAAQGGDRPAYRATAVGIVADRVAGLAEAGRGDGVGTVLGIAEDRPRRPRARLRGKRKSRQVRFHAQQGQIVFR